MISKNVWLVWVLVLGYTMSWSQTEIPLYAGPPKKSSRPKGSGSTGLAAMKVAKEGRGRD